MQVLKHNSRYSGGVMTSPSMKKRNGRFEHLGAALREDRRNCQTPDGQLSAERLAVELDKSPEWVWAVERGEIAVTVKALLEWSQVTGGTEGLGYVAEKLGLMTIRVPDGEPVQNLAVILASAAGLVHLMSGIYSNGQLTQAGAKRAKELREACERLVQSAVGVMARFDADKSALGKAKSLADTQVNKN